MLFDRLWQVLRITSAKKQRFLVMDVGRRRRLRLADFSSRSLELHLSAFKGRIPEQSLPLGNGPPAEPFVITPCFAYMPAPGPDCPFPGPLLRILWRVSRPIRPDPTLPTSSCFNPDWCTLRPSSRQFAHR